MMVVSIISTGAGSVAVSERPSLPATDATSGTCFITWSCQAMMRLISVSEVLGSSTGMKSRLPSLSVGMNSLPMPRGELGRTAASARPRAFAPLDAASRRPGPARNGQQAGRRAQHRSGGAPAPSPAPGRRAAAGAS